MAHERRPQGRRVMRRWLSLCVAGLLASGLVLSHGMAAPVELQDLPDWGYSQGAGTFSLDENASPLQLSLSLDQPLSIALDDGKIGGHSPIFAASVMLKIWRDKKGSKRSLWLGSSIQPIGVSVPYPNASRLEQEGSAINRLYLSGVSPVGKGQIRLDAGLVQQHLGGADSLYWSSLTPRHWTSDSIRLFDTSLGANAYYVFRSYYLEAGLGSPISNDTSPFETANGFRGQLVTGWAVDDANILIGGRTDQGAITTEHEANIRWRIPFRLLSLDLPIYISGEMGGITQPDVHQNVVGSVYANHEVGLRLSKVTLRLRYDWLDRDTHYKYDTMHLARARIDYHGMEYFVLSAQFRHRWRDTSDRFETERDDILLFVRLLY